jgi:hypothetical protein
MIYHCLDQYDYQLPPSMTVTQRVKLRRQKKIKGTGIFQGKLNFKEWLTLINQLMRRYVDQNSSDCSTHRMQESKSSRTVSTKSLTFLHSMCRTIRRNLNHVPLHWLIK